MLIISHQPQPPLRKENSPQTTRNALEPFSVSGAKSFSLPFPTGLHFNQLPSICPHGLHPIAPPSDLCCRIPLCYIPHTCCQPIHTIQLAVSSPWYSPNRTNKSWHPFLSHPHEPLNTPRSDAEPVWKSTYPGPASYCLKLSAVGTYEPLPSFTHGLPPRLNRHKSTYPCPVSYCLKLSTVSTFIYVSLLYGLH